jgi:hypothetical protein
MLAAHGVGVANDVVPGHDGRAAGGRHQRGEHADECAFARAVRPEQAEDLAGVHREAHVIDGQQRGETLADASHVDSYTVLVFRFHGG